MSEERERSPLGAPPLRQAPPREPEHRLPSPSVKARRRGRSLFVSLILAALAVVVVLTGLWMHFGSNSQLPLDPGQQTPLSPQQAHRFITPPYTAAQMNALAHLVNRMTYKELTSLSA